jgi:hypothetical protein
MDNLDDDHVYFDQQTRWNVIGQQRNVHNNDVDRGYNVIIG